MTLKHFLKRQNRSKNKIRKITVKSRNDVKSACFWHLLCYISTIFKDIDLKFCTHIHETLPSNICYGFLKILIWGKLSRKGKKLPFFWKFSKIFKILKIRDVLLRRGHSDWSASSGQPSYYFLWPAASGRARTECDIVLISLCWKNVCT